MRKRRRRYINGVVVTQYLLFTVISVYLGCATASFCGFFQGLKFKNDQLSGIESSVDRIATSFEIYNEKMGFTQPAEH